MTEKAVEVPDNTGASIHFIRESLAELTKKMDAFFRRVDAHERETADVKTKQAVMEERYGNLKDEYTKMYNDIYDNGGFVDRLRGNETKVTRVYAIGGAAMTAIGAAAFLVPLIWKH